MEKNCTPSRPKRDIKKRKNSVTLYICCEDRRKICVIRARGIENERKTRTRRIMMRGRGARIIDKGE